ncbi:reverse transcriptase domain-containing protein [Tanacetum coccineum]|uniref:Reverse transcriptase domain-containing protein n=1 Tax=Tanacetum coccineum TaxID=301880 RepID=A0ABQ5F8G9_9ASTR
MEKLVLALVHASKRLKRPRVSVKGQILVDFIVKRPEEDFADTPMEEEEELYEPWILFTDGSSCTDGSKAGLILTNPEGMEFTYALRFKFDATNNEAEYEALIAGLRIAEQMGVKKLQANVDLRLVANQVNGTYVAKEAGMICYLEKVKALTISFKAFIIKQNPRSENKKSNALSKIASTSFAHLSKQVLVEDLKEKSISEVEVLAVVEEKGDTWMTPIFKYLAEETLPTDMKKARAIRRKSWWFVVINGILYKKSFLVPWIRCIGPLQANYVLREIHEGSCSMHAGTRSVVAKALRNGYYWPTMHKDARTLILYTKTQRQMTVKELEIPMSVGSLAGSAANVPNEELEMAIAGPVDNNIVGAEVVPFSMGRSVLARTVAQRTAIPLSFKKGKHVVLADPGPCSPKSVPDFAPCDEACKTLSGATTKGQRPKRTIKLPSHLQDYAM